MKDQNKELISKTQELLKTKGYDVKTSHLYDVFAQLSGYKNWHVASIKNVNLAENIKKFVNETPFSKEETFESYVNKFFLDEEENQIELKIIDPSMAGWNYSVIGQTGSGKTVLVNKIISQLVVNNKPMIYIFDYDGEIAYQKFIKLNQGKVINFNKNLPKIQVLEIDPKISLPTEHKTKKIRDFLIDKYQLKKDPAEIDILLKEFYHTISTYNTSDRIHLNSEDRLSLFNEIFSLNETLSFDLFKILELKEGECSPSTKDFRTIIKTLEIMLSSNHKDLDGFVLFDESAIVELVKNTFESIGKNERRFPKISDLIKESLLDKKLGENFRKKLSLWTSSGKYPFFEETTMDLSGYLILTNFKGLESDPVLRKVYILQVQEKLMNKINSAQNKVKVVVREGAAQACQDQMIRHSFFENLRTSRKNGICTISISQSLTDYLVPNVKDGKSIMCNFQGHILGKLPSDSIADKIGLELGLSQLSCEKIKSLGIKKVGEEKHQEFMVVKNKEAKVYKNKLNSIEEFVYGSSDEEQALISYYLKEKNQSLFEVLSFLSKKGHFGDHKLAEFLEKNGFISLARKVLGIET